MLKYRPLPPLKRLNELLEVVEIPEDKYGKWSGLRRKVSRGGKRAGCVAGRRKPSTKNPTRFDWRVSVDDVQYVASRVIYYMVTGEDPGNTQVDHIDQNPLNNNFYNLRLSTENSVQKINRSVQKNNTSHAVGVYWNKKTKKWQAQVQNNGRGTYLGRFLCKIEAAHVVNEKWIELGWDKLGRKLNDLEAIECDCDRCT